MVHMWQEVELSLFITGNTAMRYMNRWLDVWFGLPESRLHVGLEGSQISRDRKSTRLNSSHL